MIVHLHTESCLVLPPCLNGLQVSIHELAKLSSDGYGLRQTKSARACNVRHISIIFYPILPSSWLKKVVLCIELFLGTP